jgi:hypothetical protein
MSNLNQQIKAAAEPGVFKVIEWALMVHEDTMRVINSVDHCANLVGKFTLDEREEARKILLEYGAGKPTRIVEHRGSRKQPIAFETVVIGPSKQLPEPETIEAEFIE